jgi:hypothetical protein
MIPVCSLVNNFLFFFIYTTVQIFFDCHFRLVTRCGLAYPYTDAAALRLTYAFRVGALILR